MQTARFLSLVEYLEPLVGYRLEIARDCLRANEHFIAFEQICSAVLDEPVAVDQAKLEDLSQIAEEYGEPELLASLAEVRAGVRRRPWMDQHPRNEPLSKNESDWWPVAEDVREAQDFDEILPKLSDLIGRQPSAIEIARFVRMIFPEASFESVADAVVALASGDLQRGSRLLERSQ